MGIGLQIEREVGDSGNTVYFTQSILQEDSEFQNEVLDIHRSLEIGNTNISYFDPIKSLLPK